MTIPYRWLAAALVVLAALAGAFYQGDKHGAAVVQAAWDKERAAIAEAGAKAQAAIDKTHETQEAAVAASDDFRTKELSHEIADIDVHSAAIAAGTERVRIVARCPAGSSNLPKAAPGVGPVDDATVELSRDSEQLVQKLKRDIVSDQVKIKALQDYAAAVQQ